jgi:hypothetical protein
MTRKTKGRAVLVAFGVVAVLAALTSVWEPAHWVIGVFGSHFSDPGPPKILGDARCTNRRDCAAANAALNATLHRRFPQGATQQSLISALNAEGFRPRPAALAKCGSASLGKQTTPCPAWDPNWDPENNLEYDWGKLPCGSSVSVKWSVDARGVITHLEGSYGYDCL